MSALRLDDRVAVVTGSGRGLGRAYAVALARAGAAVVVNDLDGDAAQETVAAVAADGGRAVAEVCAVGDTAAAEALVARAVAEFGRLDVMVTNAGLLRDRVLWKMTDEDFDMVTHTHLRGTFTCARAAAVQMRARRSVCEAARHRRGRLAGRPAWQLRADELRGREGRHRGVRPHVGDGARAQRDHRQRDRPDGVDADDREHPDLRAARRAGRGRRAAAARGPPGARDRHAGGQRRARGLPGLGCGGERDRAGDRHRRRPAEHVVAPDRDRRRVQRGRLDAGADRRELGGHRRRRRADLRRRAAAAAAGRAR